MYSSMWFMSIVALLVVDVRTGALQDGDIRPGRCHACGANGTTCDGSWPAVSCPEDRPLCATVAIGPDIRPGRCHACGANGTTCDGSWPAVSCPEDRPLCATVAIGPDFVSSLACAAASTSACSSRIPANSSLEVTCVCNTHLCNAPFSPELRNELLNFTLTLTNNSTDTTQIFFQSTKFANVTDENLYKAITIEVTEAMKTIARNLSQPTTVMTVPGTINTQSILRDSEKPRAEPLKQEPTAPSDDDEDEGEGSGAYEESRVHNHAVSAPAAPSSFLPANENSASRLHTDTLLTTLFIYLVV